MVPKRYSRSLLWSILWHGHKKWMNYGFRIKKCIKILLETNPKYFAYIFTRLQSAEILLVYLKWAHVKLAVLIYFASYIYFLVYSYHTSSYWNNESCHSFSLLKAIAKFFRRSITICIGCNIEKKAKRLRSITMYMRSNSEKKLIVLQKKWILGAPKSFWSLV